MVVMYFLVYMLVLLGLVNSEKLSLFASNRDNGKRVSLGEITVDEKAHNITGTTLDASSLIGTYCFGAEGESYSNDCFCYLKVDGKKHNYTLMVDVNDDIVESLTWMMNDYSNGTTAEVRLPVHAPQPPPIKLKKTTKTYAEKKAESKLDAAKKKGKEEEDNEEEDQRTFFEKNWKKMLIGFLIYNLIAGFSKSQQQQGQQQQQ